MNQDLGAAIATKLNLAPRSVASVVRLFDGGATIPFIARYRKESTGGLNEVDIQKIEQAITEEKELISRKDFILVTIEAQGLLTDSLRISIERADDIISLEDLYLPFKKKRKTKATMARDLGLAPLAELITEQGPSDPRQLAKQFANDQVKTPEEALQGASDIIAEQIAEMAWVRQALRNDYQRHGVIKSTLIKGQDEEGSKYRDYFQSEEKIARCPSHRLLALLRGESEGILRLSIFIDQERSLASIKRKLLKPQTNFYPLLNDAIEDSYKRLIAPSLENETRNFYKEKADLVAIEIFVKNVRQLLLAAPLGEKVILALDPGFRSGCKMVVINAHGDLLHHSTIYPHPPQNELENAANAITKLCAQYRVEAIAIGNGTAGRETLQFAKSIPYKTRPDVYLVNENGASIYSASEVAREEFPDHDITVRGAVSIGRRLMDPLAELVKIDAKSIGVGQYQHDVNQKQLQDSLNKTVSSCVNLVGVNVNTASKHLLQHVSGLGPTLAQNIVDFRKAEGAFVDRKSLTKVPRLGDKAFEQCAGFLRVRGAKNPLDDTAVHPESYHIVQKMASDLSCTLAKLISDAAVRSKIDLRNYISTKTGLPTLQDILAELEKPGLDPRGKAQTFEFNQSIKSIDDLHIGMQIPGLVTNVTNFGAFINIGIKQDGLIHISQLGRPPVSLHVEDQVYVKILEVDTERNRIQLQLVQRITNDELLE